MNKIRQYIAVKAFIQNKQGELLIIQESNQEDENTNVGKWDVPGGRLESGEKPLEALLREVKEEVGLDIIIGEPFGIRDWFYEYSGTNQVIAIYFICQAINEDIFLSKEHDNYKWVDKYEIEKFSLMDGYEDLLEKYYKLIS